MLFTNQNGDILLTSQPTGINRRRRALGMLGAFVVGMLVTTQGICNRALGVYYGGSYQHAGMMSLSISTAGFVLVAVVRWLLRPLLRRNGKEVKPLGIDRLLFGVSWRERMKFIVSGSPGACFIVVFATAINVATSAVAGIVAMGGILGFTVAVNWRSAQRGRWPIVVGVVGMLVATLLVSIGTIGSPAQQVSPLLVAIFIVLSFAFGLGVGWQFVVIKDMRLRSSNLGAAIMSSASGLATEAVLVVVMAALPVGGWVYLPDPLWPTSLGDLWRFAGGVAGFWLIFIATYAVTALVKAYKDKLGPAVYMFVLALGMLTVSFIYGFDVSVVWVAMLQMFGFLIAAVSVYLCVVRITAAAERAH